MKPVPIRLRLTLWYFTMFATAAVLLSVCSWLMLRESLDATEYHELQERAEDVQLLLKQQSPEESPESLRRLLAEIYKVKDDGKYLQVLDQNGQWLYRSRRMSAADPSLPLASTLPANGALSEFREPRHLVRTLAYPIVANGHAYSVQTGMALERSRALLFAFRSYLLLLTPVVLILAAVGGHVMSRKALAPVAEIAMQMRQISDRNLDVRLPVSASGDELSQLSETLNKMLERIESGVRSIREFTANAAHELRTPIALIRTEVEVVLSFPRSAAEYRESCRQVQMEAVRMTSLIDSLLMLARADAGTEAVRLEALDVSQLVLQTAAKWRVPMQQAMLDFRVEAASPAFILGDSQSIQRLLTILLDNAVRYTPPGGSVTLTAAAQDGCVCISVHDTGVGIAAEHIDRIFDRFYRIDRVRGGKSGGSGLGLALAKWIAGKHGALLTVESETGKGTAFSFRASQIQAPVQPLIDSRSRGYQVKA